jgi:hypothetical protein
MKNNTGYLAILNENGWKHKIKREFIALHWVKNVCLAWSIPLENEDEDFKKQEEYTFMPPTVNTNGDDIFLARWVREPSRVLPETNFHLLTVVFSITEADIRSQITNCFNVEF